MAQGSPVGGAPPLAMPMNLGLFSCCCANIGNHDLSVKKEPKREKIRPLLADLEGQFREFCGDDNQLNESELIRIWKKAAAQKVGKLTKEDESLIEDSCKIFFKRMDADTSGTVSYEEFVTFMMGASDEGGPGMAVDAFRKDVNKALKADPDALQKLITQFKSWDKNGDGKVSKDEMSMVLEEMRSSNAKHTDIKKMEKIKKEIFLHADIDGDGHLDLWEVMAYMLGRKRQPVEVLMYDVSKGFAAKWTPILMGKKVQAVHTGVLVYGSEYWCGGKIYRSDPPCTKCFGDPLKEYSAKEPLEASEQRPELPVIKMGYTFVTHDEFVQWMSKKIIPRYDREKYDLLTHSCNHYTNEAVTFLTGNPLPERIFDLQKAFLTPTVIAMRPFLNKYMCCFGDAHKSVDTKTKFSEDYMPEEREGDHTAMLTELAGTGEVILLTGLDIEGIDKDEQLVGTVTRHSGGTFDVKYFDPNLEKIVEAKDVSSKSVQRLTES